MPVNIVTIAQDNQEMHCFSWSQSLSNGGTTGITVETSDVRVRFFEYLHPTKPNCESQPAPPNPLKYELINNLYQAWSAKNMMHHTSTRLIKETEDQTESNRCPRC